MHSLFAPCVSATPPRGNPQDVSRCLSNEEMYTRGNCLVGVGATASQTRIEPSARTGRDCSRLWCAAPDLPASLVVYCLRAPTSHNQSRARARAPTAAAGSPARLQRGPNNLPAQRPPSSGWTAHPHTHLHTCTLTHLQIHLHTQTYTNSQTHKHANLTGRRVSFPSGGPRPQSNSVGGWATAAVQSPAGARSPHSAVGPDRLVLA